MKIVPGFPVNLSVICLFALVISCDIKESNADPSESFSAVYDHPETNVAFHPVDLAQTSDGGFLILSVYTDTMLSTFPLIRLMKTSDAGIITREVLVDGAYCSAVPSLMKKGSQWQFVCMDAVNQNVKRMQVNEDLTGLSEIDELNGKYPLYLYQDSRNNFVILTFDRIARTSELTQYASNGDVLWEDSYNINEDYKNQVETHLRRRNQRFPFFVSEVDAARYMVNCFYNYTMTLLFVNAANGNITGQLNTYQDDAAISSAVYLGDSRFSTSRYYMGENYIFSSVSLNVDDTQGSNTFNDLLLSELTADAEVRSLVMEINGRDVIVFASQTRSNQLVLYFFDHAEGTLLAVKYLASTNPIEIGAVVATEDGGLALLAQTYIAGRYPRIALYKVSPKEIDL